MTHPSLDEVIAVLTGVLGPPSADFRAADLQEVDWRFPRGYVFVDINAEHDAEVVAVSAYPSDDGAISEWLVTRDGAPVDGDDTVTLDALPGLVAASVARLGLGEAVAT